MLTIRAMVEMGPWMLDQIHILPAQPTLTSIAILTQEIRVIVDARFPPAATRRVDRQILAENLQPNRARDPNLAELTDHDQFTVKTRMLRAALHLVHRGIASSLDVDERAAGLPPESTGDDYVAPKG